MYHGLTNDFLYTAYKINVEFSDDIGNVRHGYGTCFFILNKIGKLCLVTNRHILDFQLSNKDEVLSNLTLNKIIISGKEKDIQNNIIDTTMELHLSTRITYDNDINNDVACICDIQLKGQNKTVDFYIKNDWLATEEDFQNKLSICDFLAFPGFPEWHDKIGKRPILRTGTIASDPRFDYSYGEHVRGACLAYEAFSYGGSSGSPIFAVQKGLKPGKGILFPGYRPLLLIGINAGHLKISSDGLHSGISYFYKSTVIDKLINNS